MSGKGALLAAALLGLAAAPGTVLAQQDPPEPERSTEARPGAQRWVASLSAEVQATEPARPPPSGDLPVVARTLENGMRVLALRRTASPTVAFVVRYGVGGVDEHVGVTGTAHLLEHLLFKGTRTVGGRDPEAEEALFRVTDALQDSILRERGRLPRPDSARIRRLADSIRVLEDSARTFVVPNEFDRILSRNGARGLNATTTNEATTYFVELPSNRVKLWFTLEADRMREPIFREFYTERDVVMEERRLRVETDPGGLLYEAHLAAAFRMHPYGQPVVGWMSDLEGLTRPGVRAYHRRFYGPRNAVVAVVGDVEPDSVLRWAGSYFGGVPPGEVPPPVLAREPAQRGERRVEVRFDAQPRVRMGWRVVSDLHPDMPALTMLSSLLTGGRTSRLHRRLVQEERIATFVSSSSGPGARHPQLFQIDAVPRAPHGTREVEEAVYRELDRLADEPPAEEEVERVRNQIRAARVRRLRSNLGLALELAAAESLRGDWRSILEQDRRLLEVTPEDVRRVVRRYFTPENRTVATLVREPSDRERP